MSLQETLAEMKKKSAAKVPPEALEIMLGTTRRLVESGIAEQSTKKGDKIPEVELPNATGDKVNLKDLLAKGPVVINFYRGGWCPYCSVELREFQKVLPEIKELGATLIAISPELPDNSLSTKEKNELEFEVLSDQGNKVAKDFGLVFELADDLKKVYDKFGLDIPKFNGDNSWEIPMPATYVIDTDGTVKYSFIEADYTLRAEPSDIIKALKK